MNYEDYAKKNGIEKCVRDKNGFVVALCVGYSEEELKKLLKNHPGWYVSDLKVS